MPKNTIMDRSPKAVADYAQDDSEALKDVDLDDILIRGTESCKMHRMKIITRLEALTKDLRESYIKSI